MGTQSYLGNPPKMARPKAQPKTLHRTYIDLPMVLIVAVLIIFGILMVYSASSDIAFKWKADATYILVRQLGWIGLGIGVCVLFAWLDYHIWRKLALPAMLVTLGMLVAVQIISNPVFGSERTLVGSSVQPSELAKLVLIIYLAVWLESKRDQIRVVSLGLVPLGVIIGLVGAFIIAQPDVSAFVTVVLIGLMMFFLAGGDWRQLFLVFGIGIFVGWVFIRSGIIPTAYERVFSFLEGIHDPTQYSDHVQRSIEAFMQGGWLGVGLGESRTKLLSLPVPHTDSIYAVIGEELGVWGSVVVVILFGLLLWRGMVIARRAPDELGSLLAGGIAFWITTEAFINISVIIGLMPFAGNALPFFSYGGSSMVVTLAAIGIILSVSRLSAMNKQQEEVSGAVVDLRRRDRRGRVSRSVRSAPYEE